MCGSSAVGVTQDGGRSTSGTGSTAAHELGHEFNMGHDASECYTISSLSLLSPYFSLPHLGVTVRDRSKLLNLNLGCCEVEDKPASVAVHCMHTVKSGSVVSCGFTTGIACNSSHLHASTVCHAHTQLPAHALILLRDASWRQSRDPPLPPSGAAAAELTSRLG